MNDISNTHTHHRLISLVYNKAILEVEGRLRQFTSDLLHPFNERLHKLEKDTKDSQRCYEAHNSKMLLIDEKLSKEAKLRDLILDQSN